MHEFRKNINQNKIFLVPDWVLFYVLPNYAFLREEL